MSIVLRIGFPYEVTQNEWACPLSMEGFQDDLPDVHGVDAWQAVQLVQGLQAQLLGYFVQNGGKLLGHEPPEPIELDELFPKIPTTRT